MHGNRSIFLVSASLCLVSSARQAALEANRHSFHIDGLIGIAANGWTGRQEVPLSTAYPVILNTNPIGDPTEPPSAALQEQRRMNAEIHNFLVTALDFKERLFRDDLLVLTEAQIRAFVRRNLQVPFTDKLFHNFLHSCIEQKILFK